MQQTTHSPMGKVSAHRVTMSESLCRILAYYLHPQATILDVLDLERRGVAKRPANRMH